jgi:hypothetical protein
MGHLADIKVVPDSQEVEVQQDDGEALLLLNPIFFLFSIFFLVYLPRALDF